MIYHAEIRFEPLISHIYHLYEDENGNFFLMMIGENEWGRKNALLSLLVQLNYWQTIHGKL